MIPCTWEIIQIVMTVDEFMAGVVARNPHEPVFHQAVHEVVASVGPSTKV